MSNRYFDDAWNTKSISGAQTYGLLAIAQAIENLAAVLQQNRNAPPPFGTGTVFTHNGTAEGPNGRYEASR